MKTAFEYILKNYLPESRKEFKNNNIARFLRRDASKTIEKKAAIDTAKYKIEGSPGQGRWVTVPWIGVFDKRITTTAMKGFYIVYLFRADMSGVYLSLNQGWTFFENNYKNVDRKERLRLISTVADNLRKKLNSTLNDFSDEKIDLIANRKIEGTQYKLPKGYEAGHICGKFYPTNEIPDDIELINDLRNLMGVYRELIGIVGTDYENVVKNFLSHTPIRSLDLKNEIETDYDIEKEVNFLEGLDKPKKPEEFKNPEEYNEYTEGRRKLIQHITRERNVQVIKKAKENFKSKNNSLYCEICGFDFEKKYGEIGRDYIEGHHILPISQIVTEYNTIRPEEIALVCSNCHRILHRKKPWLTVKELKKLIK